MYARIMFSNFGNWISPWLRLIDNFLSFVTTRWRFAMFFISVLKTFVKLHFNFKTEDIRPSMPSIVMSKELSDKSHSSFKSNLCISFQNLKLFVSAEGPKQNSVPLSILPLHCLNSKNDYVWHVAAFCSR